MAAVDEADTIWQPSSPLIGEYAIATASDIDDPSGVLLVDPSAVQIVDTGATFTLIPASVWLDSPGN